MTCGKSRRQLAVVSSIAVAACALIALLVTARPAQARYDADPPKQAPADRATPPQPQEQPNNGDRAVSIGNQETVSPSAVPGKLTRYSRRLLDQYDENRNGQLEEVEWRKMHGEPAQSDRNRDGIISLEELVDHIAGYGHQRKIRLLPPQPGDLMEMAPLLNPEIIDPSPQRIPIDDGEYDALQDDPAATPQGMDDPPAEQPQEASRRDRRDTKFYVPSSRLPSSLPATFLNRDRDGDGQLTLAEFAVSKSRAELDEFARLDRNADGVITAAEYLARSASAVKDRSSAEADEPK